MIFKTRQGDTEIQTLLAAFPKDPEIVTMEKLSPLPICLMAGNLGRGEILPSPTY